jgi:carbon storage regulator CsrA
MLILARKIGERIVLPGLGITVEVLSFNRGVVRLGWTAPEEINIVRSELLPDKQNPNGDDHEHADPPGGEA